MGYTLKLNGSVAKNVRIVSGGQTSEVNTILNDDGVVWDKPVLIDSPMRVVNNVSGTTITVTLTKTGTPHDIYMEYSSDGTNWSVWSPAANGNRTASIAKNGNLWIRGENPLGFYVDDNNRYSFNASGKYALAGNLNAWYSKYESDSLPANCFRKFFYQSTNLNNISYVRFPATRLGDYAYDTMFWGCSGLTLAPHWLPATQLGDHAYDSMFYGCTALTTMPMIYAREFPDSCCSRMFSGCTSLTKQWASESATSSATRNITLNVERVGDTAMHSMFYQTKIATAADIHLDATELGLGSYKLMFYKCTSLTTGPEIKATTLNDGEGNNQNGSLAYMFQGCTSLNYIKVHFTDWNSGNYTLFWTQNAPSSGTFVKPDSLPATKNASGNTSSPNYIPYNWTVQSTTPPSTKSYNVVTSSTTRVTLVLSSGDTYKPYYIVAAYEGNYYMMRNSNWSWYYNENDGIGTFYDNGTQVTVTDNSVLTVPYSTDMSQYSFYATDGKLSFGTVFLGNLTLYETTSYTSRVTNLQVLDRYPKGFWKTDVPYRYLNNTVRLEFYSGWALSYGPIGYAAPGNCFKLITSSNADWEPENWKIMLFSTT